MARLKRC